MSLIHTPVLLKESCEYVITNPSGTYFDATLGFGGHTAEFLQKLSTQAIIIASDVDEAAFTHSQERFSGDSRVKLYRFNFTKIDIMAKLEMVDGFDGIFADLGVSSYQLDEPEEGFSFKLNAKLDLRLDKTLPNTAADLLNTLDDTELADIFFKYGEERNSRKIAAKIVEKRKIKKFVVASDLAEIITQLTPPNYVRKTMTRIFQALRIYINDELETLRQFLNKSVNLLKPGGRLAILSYHSLEDRIVKEIMKYEALTCICPPGFPICTCGKQQRLKMLTGKGITPSQDEITGNYRARSAKLRGAERV
ncbi:MAG: 16S rRNA (cytosine(1402)-N(4))-methyltransferase RsmH [Ignavibacteriales bacterium]|nr:16S rRNA (cytosine(1402)-N(4))-methyltransferase RsmH [Ignavibacteriales bacterium]